VLQRFVLLLGHACLRRSPSAFALLLCTRLGAAWSRTFDAASLRRSDLRSARTVAASRLAVVFRRPRGVTGDPGSPSRLGCWVA